MATRSLARKVRSGQVKCLSQVRGRAATKDGAADMWREREAGKEGGIAAGLACCLAGLGGAAGFGRAVVHRRSGLASSMDQPNATQQAPPRGECCDPHSSKRFSSL